MKKATFLVLFTIIGMPIWADPPVETIENGIKATDPITFQVERDLVLGNDLDRDDTLFAYGISAAGTTDGTIFVMDRGNHRICVFDKHGKTLRIFGSEGQGPGEFQELDAMTIDPKGRVVTFDSGSKRVSYFDQEGNFLDSTNFAPNIQAIFTPVVLANGHIGTGLLDTGNTGQLTYRFQLFDAQMKPIKSYIDVPQPDKDWSQMQQPGFWEDFLVDQFTAYGSGLPFGSPLGDDRFIVVRTNQYAGQVVDQTGKVLFSFTKQHKPQPLSEDAKRVIFEEMWQAMATNPFLSQFITQPVFERALTRMDDLQMSQPLTAVMPVIGGFVALAERDPMTHIGQLDYFDMQGQLRGSTTIKGPAYNVSGVGNTLYLTGLDEEDNVVVMRYRIKGI